MIDLPALGPNVGSAAGLPFGRLGALEAPMDISAAATGREPSAGAIGGLGGAASGALPSPPGAIGWYCRASGCH
ncbi:hypothetical protein NKH18_05485 [Streptomyces sp. M10(2022)]